MSRRRGGDRAVVVIYWRDIPAQVTAGDRATGDKVLLDARFQHAIDRAAAVAGKTDTASYVAEWRRVTHPLTGDPSAAAAGRAAELDSTFAQDRLEQLVRSGGVATDPDPGDDRTESQTDDQPSTDPATSDPPSRGPASEGWDT